MKYQEQITNNKLREKREALGLTQQNVADLLGHHYITDRISHWEKGRAIPSIINLFKLCALYGVQPCDVYPELVGRVNRGFHSQSQELVSSPR